MATDVDETARHDGHTGIDVGNDQSFSRRVERLSEDASIRRNDSRIPPTRHIHQQRRARAHQVNALGSEHRRGVQHIRLRLDGVGLRERLAALLRFISRSTPRRISGIGSTRTFLRQAPQLRAPMRRQGRPRRDVDLLALRRGVVLQQRLGMFPAGETSDALARLGRHHIEQAVAAAVAKHGALDVRGLQLAAVHQQRPVRVDDRLRDVQRVVVVLGKAQHNDDAVLPRARLDGPHLVRVDGE